MRSPLGEGIVDAPFADADHLQTISKEMLGEGVRQSCSLLLYLNDEVGVPQLLLMCSHSFFTDIFVGVVPL